MGTWRIVSMERAETKNSRSPMWRCVTEDGERVNVFSHIDPYKDSFGHFVAAGYASEMRGMEVGQQMTWHAHPIEVRLLKRDDYWNVIGVEKRPDGAEPDAMYVPDFDYWRGMAQAQATLLLEDNIDAPRKIIIDVETTGLMLDDEIVSVCVLHCNHHAVNALVDTLVRPGDPQKLNRAGKWGKTAADVTGITPEILEDAPTFNQVVDHLDRALQRSIWMGWNVDFDTFRLHLACEGNHDPFVQVATVDVMRIFAWYSGAWDRTQQVWKRVSLGDAADYFFLAHDEAHSAKGDALMVWKILKAMAEGAANRDEVAPF